MKDDQVFFFFWHGWFANKMCRLFWEDAGSAVTEGKHPTDCASGYIFILCWNAMVLKPYLFTLRSDCFYMRFMCFTAWGWMWSVIPCLKMNTEFYHFPFIRILEGCKVWAPTIFYWKGTHSYSSLLLAEQFLPSKSTASLVTATQAWK